MANKNHRRRFYPKFYTDKELENNNQCSEYDGYDENGQNEIESMESDDDCIQNLFDRTKNPETPIEFNEIEAIKKIEEESEIPAEDKLEISIEIPPDMLISPLIDFDSESHVEPPELSEFNETETEKVNEMFEIVSGSSNEPELSDLSELPKEDLSLSIPTFAEYSEINPEETKVDLERITEPENAVSETEPVPEPENISPPGIIPFDRESAIEYAHRWALQRNPGYFDFEDIGGDCTNYVSQTLLAGGCKMDKSSVLFGWYYINANDKSPSWTGVEQLYDYLTKEKDYGIIAREIDLNSVEAGDIAQLSFNGKTYQHSPFIVSVKRNSDDSVSSGHIKICAHSFDSENRALDTYQWKKIRFIRIEGFKER